MASLLRYSAVAAFVSAVAGKSFGSLPSQTAGGNGLPLFAAMPTEAPSLELLKRKLEKKSLTNVCSEWTIQGGNGQPQCYNSQTCLFTSVDGYFYEGCGQTSIQYDWITECYNYPNAISTVAGPSQTFCDADFPSCGVFEFRYSNGFTFSNFGCSTASYSYVATLLPTTSGFDSTGLAAGGTSKLSVDATTRSTGTDSSDDFATPTGSQSTRTSRPSPSSRPKKKAPIGAIVGGVIGGVAVIAFAVFAAWFCIRKRKQDKAKAAPAAVIGNNSNLQYQANGAPAAATAYHATQGGNMSEIDGTMKPAAAFIPVNYNQNNAHGFFSPNQEKNPQAVANEYRPGLQQPYNNGYSTDPHSGTQSPPPVYVHPSPQPQYPPPISSPSSGYTELDTSATPRQSMLPGSVSPRNSGAMMSGNVSELGAGENRTSYQAYHPPTSPQSPPQNMAPMSSSTGGINRRPVQQHSLVDMSGAPLNENFRSHELP